MSPKFSEVALLQDNPGDIEAYGYTANNDKKNTSSETRVQQNLQNG